MLVDQHNIGVLVDMNYFPLSYRILAHFCCLQLINSFDEIKDRSSTQNVWSACGKYTPDPILGHIYISVIEMRWTEGMDQWYQWLYRDKLWGRLPEVEPTWVFSTSSDFFRILLNSATRAESRRRRKLDMDLAVKFQW